MYCNCSSGAGGKCKRPTVCASKVCTETLDADFVNAFVVDADEVTAKKVTADEIDINIPAGTEPPQAVFVVTAPPAGAAPSAQSLDLPVFGVPFGGFGAVPGVGEPTVGVSGSNTLSIFEVTGAVAAGSVLQITFSNGGFPSATAVVYEFWAQELDVVSEGYVVGAPPTVVSASQTGAEILFSDAVMSATSKWAGRATVVV